MKSCHVSLMILAVCVIVYMNGCGEQKSSVPIRVEGAAVGESIDNDEVTATANASANNTNIMTRQSEKTQSVQSLKERLLARLKGKPALLVFSMRTCCGGDMSEEIAWELANTYSEVLRVLYIDALRDRELALECGVETLPTGFLYDSEGKEKGKIEGNFSMEEIEAMLNKNGIRRRR